jgi:hypothetical protein
MRSKFCINSIILLVTFVLDCVLYAAGPSFSQVSPGRDGTGFCLQITQGNSPMDIRVRGPVLAVVGDTEYVFKGFYAAVSGQTGITGHWRNSSGLEISSFNFLLPDTQNRWEAFFDEFISPIGAEMLDIEVCVYSSQASLRLDDFSLRRGTLADYASEFNPPAVRQGKPVFPIFAWCTPDYYPEFGDDAAFFDTERMHAEYALANFTIGPAKAKKYGCRELLTSTLSSNTTVHSSDLDPNVWGFIGKDEPDSDFFPLVLSDKIRVKQLAPSKSYYVNLYPNYATETQMGVPTYTQYVRDFLAYVDPNIVSFDHYALSSDGSYGSGFYENFETIRREAISAGTDVYGAILQSTSWGDGLRVPNEADMRWQAYSALVYGSKILGWFTYLDYLNLTDDRAAVLDDNGNRAPLYSIIKNLNGEVINLGYTLLNLTSTGVYHTANPLPSGTTNISSSTMVQSISGGQWIVGEFRDAQSRKFLMLVNRNYSGAQTGTFVLKSLVPAVQDVFEISKVTSEEAPISGYNAGTRTFTMSFLPGEGRLFRLVQ